ncbi:MAG: flavodoxin domain-containing protein [Euryarchaeota archaeon]|nr:flavodoxin domain-containing protein [Euryarchaeota archaeon]
MKVLIAYDTRYGTTEEIAHWLAEGLETDCDIKNVADVTNLDYDLIIVGSPMYTDEPLPSVVQFLHDRGALLSSKKVALFLVYDRLVASKHDTYEEMIREQAPPNILDVAIFGGYIDVAKLNENDQRTIADFFSRLGQRYNILDSRNKEEVLRFAQRLKDQWMKTESTTEG